MHASPKALNETAIAGSADKRTRLQRLEDKGADPDLPPLSFGEYLLKPFFESGQVSFAAMGAIPLTHEAIGWYQFNNGIQFNPWEINTLRGMSAAWLSESKDAEKEISPAPYVADTNTYRKEKLPQFIRSFLRD